MLISLLLPFESYALVANDTRITENSITESLECLEFKASAILYDIKSKHSDNTLIAMRFQSVSKNYNLMYADCLRETLNDAHYEGYRENALQHEGEELELISGDE